VRWGTAWAHAVGGRHVHVGGEAREAGACARTQSVRQVYLELGRSGRIACGLTARGDRAHRGGRHELGAEDAEEVREAEEIELDAQGLAHARDLQQQHAAQLAELAPLERPLAMEGGAGCRLYEQQPARRGGALAVPTWTASGESAAAGTVVSGVRAWVSADVRARRRRETVGAIGRAVEQDGRVARLDAVAWRCSVQRRVQIHANAFSLFRRPEPKSNEEARAESEQNLTSPIFISCPSAPKADQHQRYRVGLIVTELVADAGHVLADTFQKALPLVLRCLRQPLRSSFVLDSIQLRDQCRRLIVHRMPLHLLLDDSDSFHPGNDAERR